MSDNKTIVTPFEATGKFTENAYDKIIKEFGVTKIRLELIERFVKVTGHKPHRLLRRGLCFSHREFNKVLDDYEAGKQIVIYTGRGPSGNLHLGHYTILEFTVWLQKVLGAFVVFQIADSEKFWFKNKKFDEVYELGKENAKDIIALGFDPNRTFIFSNHDFSRYPAYHNMVTKLLKIIRIKDIQSQFGIKDDAPIGQLLWPIYQTAAAFSGAYGELFKNSNKVRVLVAYAIDQDPYFRLARDVASKIKHKKPSSIITQFLPTLEGLAKMSTTQTHPNAVVKTIFMDDTPNQIKKKINKYGFSGGKETLEEHKKYGGNTEVDVSFQYLRYFLEDDTYLEEIKTKYESGEMGTGELKKICIETVRELVNVHKEKRTNVTEDVVRYFYEIHKKID